MASPYAPVSQGQTNAKPDQVSPYAPRSPYAPEGGGGLSPYSPAAAVVSNPNSEVITIQDYKGDLYDKKQQAQIGDSVALGKFKKAKVGETFNIGDEDNPQYYAKVSQDQIAHVVDRGPVDDSALGAAGRAFTTAIPGVAEGITAMAAAQPVLRNLDQFGTPGRIAHGIGSIGAGILGPIISPYAPQTESTAQQQADQSHPIAQAIGGLIPQLALFKPGFISGSIPQKIAGAAIPAAVGAGVQSATELATGGQPGALGRILTAAGTNALLGRTNRLGSALLGESPVPLAETAEVAGKTGNASQDANTKANQIALGGPKQQLALPPAPEILGLPSPAHAQAELAPAPRDSRINPDIQVGVERPEPKVSTETQSNIEKLLGIDHTSGIPQQTRQFEIENAFKSADQAKQAIDDITYGKKVGVGNTPISSQLAMGNVGEFGTDRLTKSSDIKDITPQSTKAISSGQPGATTGSIAEAATPGKVSNELNPELVRQPLPSVGPLKGFLSQVGKLNAPGNSPKNEETIPQGNGSLIGDNPGIRGTQSSGKPQKVNPISQQSGIVNPALLYHLGAPVVGAAVGYQFGSTPEEKRRNAVLCALIGSGGVFAAQATQYIQKTNPDLFAKIAYESYRFLNNDPKETLNAKVQQNNPQKPLNAVQVKITNGMDVRPPSGNGQGMGQQNAQPEVPSGPREIKSPVKPPAYEIPKEDVRATPEYRKSVLDDIQKIYDRATNSPSVDVPIKRAIASDLHAAVGVTTDKIKNLDPNDLPVSALEGLRSKMRWSEYNGRVAVANRKQAFENEKFGVVQELNASPSNKMEDVATPNRAGVQYNIGQRIDNWVNDMASKTGTSLNKIWIGHNQNDVVIDKLDGDQKGSGPLFTNVVGRQDWDYNVRSGLLDQWRAPIAKAISDNNLSHTDIERAEMYGLAKTKNGLQHLLDSGLTPEGLRLVQGYADSTVKITPGQRAYYEAVRKVNDEMVYPSVSGVAHDVHNIDVLKEPDYWPIQRDYKNYQAPPEHPQLAVGSQEGLDQMSSLRKLVDDFQMRSTTKPKEGFIKERQDDAGGAVKIGGDAVDRHLRDAAHMVAYARDLKMLGEVARSPWFTVKYGNLGQSYILNHLDTLARDSDPSASVRWGWADRLARNNAVAALGLRVSQMKHLGNTAYAVQHIGIDGLADGLREAMTDKGGQFIRQNAAEVNNKFGGEQAIMDIAGMKDTYGRVQAISLSPERWVDSALARGSLIGAYKKELARLGKDPSQYADMPVDRQALQHALYVNRKIVTSPLLKDAPHAISRGELFGGDMTLKKLFYQFQSTMLRQTSNYVHDVWDLGFKKGAPGYAAVSTLAMLGAMAVDMGVTRLGHSIVQKLSGKENNPEKEPEMTKQVVAEVLKRVPVIGPIASSFMYTDAGTGIPAIDTAYRGGRGIATLIPKLYEGKAIDDVGVKGSIADIASAVGSAAGLPGSQTIAQIYKKSLGSEPKAGTGLRNLKVSVKPRIPRP